MLSVVCAIFLVMNMLVYNHAKSMVTFVDGAQPLSGATVRVVDLLGLAWWGPTLAKPKTEVDLSALGLRTTPVRLQPKGGPRLAAVHVRSGDSPRGMLVALHGYRATHTQLAPVAAWATERGWDSLLVDQRGHGDSEGTTTSIGRHEAQDAAAAIAWARAHSDRPVAVYGFSMGAAAAIGAVGRAGARPDLLILEGSYARLTEAVAWRVNDIGGDVGLQMPGKLLAPWLCAWGSLALRTNMLAQAPEDDARTVHVPTLLLHGAQDERAPVEAGRRIAAQLRGPHTLVTLPDGGHHIGLYGAQAVWSAAVESALDGLDTSR